MPLSPLFWLVALLLAAGTVTALVWPLLRRDAMAPQADGTATDIYRDQKRQLDDELAAGAITRAERDAQLNELTGRLAAELAEPAPPAPRISPRTSYMTALVLVAAIPACALVLYMAFGAPAAMRATEATGEQSPMSHQEIATMVDKLAARMKEHPEDPKGWQLLARADAALGRFDDAVAAFKEAAERAPPDATLLADWADAVGMQKQSLQGEPSTLIARALAIDPNHPKALSLAATAALERKDYDAAIAEWQKLKAQFPAGSEEARQVDAMIAEADAARHGVPPSPALGSAAPAASGVGAVASSVAQASDVSAGTPANAEASAITGRVSLDPKLRDRVRPGDALFIFARAVKGPRMPLAVVRGTAGELPRTFRLDDSMAMTPAARLSGAADVVVEARISRSGSATPSPGDLRGTSGAVKPGARDVLIVINDVVP